MTTNILYVPPLFKGDAFNCPYCHSYANQRWGHPPRVVENSSYGDVDGFAIARCDRCKEFSIWIDRKLIYPPSLATPEPNEDLPVDIKMDFEEARQIAMQSPRGAAALLRLALQKICKHLGESGNNLNDDIASLVKKGLSPKIQRALDIVRVVGNNAVHPGQIDLRDDMDTANGLFELINLIAEVMISQPKHVETMYSSLVTEPQKEAIKKRDNN